MLNAKRYPTLEKIIADSVTSDPAEAVKRNVELLRQVHAGLSCINDLTRVVDVTNTSIDRAYQLYVEGQRLAEEINLLIHDLRDDYGTGYRLVKPEQGQ